MVNQKMNAGINIDLRNPVGRPPVSALKGFTHARINYDISMERGSTDINAAHELYGGYIAQLRAAGIIPVLVCTHEMWGEGQGFDWNAMSEWHWNVFINGDANRIGYVEMMRRLANLYRDGVIYQVLNEQDSEDGRASVIIPPVYYGRIFNATYNAIKAVNSNATVITGGYVSGSGRGVTQYRDAKITKTDGVSFHPYGASAGGLFIHNGITSINTQLAQWQALGQPLYISEWGVLDKPDANITAVANYAKYFLIAVSGKVKSAMWYGWADGMDNGYGVAASNGVVKQALFTSLTTTPVVTQPPVVVTPPVSDPALCTVEDLTTALNVRAEPKTTAAKLGALVNGSQIGVYVDVINSGGYKWRKIRYNGRDGWIAVDAVDKISIKL